MDHLSKLFKLAVLFVLFAALVVPAGPVSAQEEQSEFTIGLRRDFGYGGFANDIEGLFTIRASGPEDLVQVRFYIDDQLMAEVTEEPFSHQFRTEEYDLGSHTFHAEGLTASGEVLMSNEITATFVSPEASRNVTISIVAVVLGLVLGATLIAGGVSMFSRRGSKASGKVPVSYGAFGGAVCPKCNKPFPRHWWGLNIVVGKFDRCPHCGKWSIVQRALPEELRLAEELMEMQQQPERREKDTQEDIRRDLDESKYLD